MWYHLLESATASHPRVLGEDSETSRVASVKYRLHISEDVKELVICVTFNNACHHVMHDIDVIPKLCPGLHIGNGIWRVFESSLGIRPTDGCLDTK